MEETSNADRRSNGRRWVVLGAGAFWMAWACGEAKSGGTSETTSSDTASTQATVATVGATSSATSAGGSGSDGSVETSGGETSVSSVVSSVSVGNEASGGSVTSESTSDTSGTGGVADGGSGGNSGAGGQISSGGANSTVASAALSLTAAATTSSTPICASGGGGSPLCLTDEEMEYQARYGYGREPLDPPRSDEEIAAAWDEQGCLPGNWVGSACCNPGIRTVGRLGDQCCYITCEGELCCGGFSNATNTSTVGGS